MFEAILKFFTNAIKYTDGELFQALQKDEIAITEQDIQKARENDPDTFYKIGDIYYKNKKYEKAFAWFYKATLQEHAGSQAQVGWMYRLGWGVSQDFKQAMDWSMKAASKGNANGQYNIGDLYYYGRGVSQDYKQAMYWFMKSASNGIAEAMNEIGWMYQHGEGVTKNIPTAIEWFTKAANQGDKRAQGNLGLIYQYQDGYKDLQKAVNWYQKSADNGYLIAKYCLDKLNRYVYYAKEGEQEGETIQDDNANNDQNQPSTSNSDNEHLNKTIEDKIKDIEKTFQLNMSLMEVNTDILQKEVAALKREKLEQHEENKQLRDELAKLKAGREDDTGFDLNYDSSDNESNNDNDINYDTECSEEGENNATARYLAK